MPQFQRRVVVAVQSTPLAARARQAFIDTWWMGGRPYSGGTQTSSIAVPQAVPQALMTMALWRFIRCLLSSTQPRAMTSERTTKRSPAIVGPAGPEAAWAVSLAPR